MKTIGYYIRKANETISEALEAERAYCVNLSKNKHTPTEETGELLEAANKTYQTAKRNVKNVYKMLEMDAPMMYNIHQVQMFMETINRKYAAFWEDLANNK